MELGEIWALSPTMFPKSAIGSLRVSTTWQSTTFFLGATSATTSHGEPQISGEGLISFLLTRPYMHGIQHRRPPETTQTRWSETWGAMAPVEDGPASSQVTRG